MPSAFAALNVHLPLIGSKEIAAAAHDMEWVSSGACRQHQSNLVRLLPVSQVSESHSPTCGVDGDDRMSDRRSVVFWFGDLHASQLKTAVVPEAFFHVSEVRRQSGGTRITQQVSRLLER